MARSAREYRDVNGILLLDKPRGISSNRALQEAKRILKARKAGHTGSLDPLASGLLPLCFGEATKVSRFLLDADKRYWAVFRLGQVTTTDDAEGEVLETRPVTVDRAAIEAALRRFVGEIDQVPPMYSAIKQGGQPLYRLARAGITTERQSRRVRIDAIRLLAWERDRLELDISCSKGTYIRTLAHDLGQALGCGAFVAELRRVAMGGFDIHDAVTLEDLASRANPLDREALLLPGDRAVAGLPAVSLSPHAAYYLCQGQPVMGGAGYPPGWVRVYQEGGQFLGLGEVLDDGRVAPRRLQRSVEGADIPNKSVEDAVRRG